MKEIKVNDPDAVAKTFVAGQGNIGPRLAAYDGDNCGCGGVMILQPTYPSQPFKDKQEWKCGLCSRITYLDVGPRPVREDSDQAPDSTVEAS